MAEYKACANCGYSEHLSHGSEFCPRCGVKLSGPIDEAREVCPEERAKAYESLQKAKKHFHETGGWLS